MSSRQPYGRSHQKGSLLQPDVSPSPRQMTGQRGAGRGGAVRPQLFWIRRRLLPLGKGSKRWRQNPLYLEGVKKRPANTPQLSAFCTLVPFLKPEHHRGWGQPLKDGEQQFIPEATSQDQRPPFGVLLGPFVAVWISPKK